MAAQADPVPTDRFAILEHEALSWGLTAEVPPGGEVWAGSDTISGCPGGPEGPATSPGFTAPLQWTIGGNFGRFSGWTTAVATPGVYTATLKCKGSPILGELQFTILGSWPIGPARPFLIDVHEPPMK